MFWIKFNRGQYSAPLYCLCPVSAVWNWPHFFTSIYFYSLATLPLWSCSSFHCIGRCTGLWVGLWTTDTGRTNTTNVTVCHAGVGLCCAWPAVLSGSQYWCSCCADMGSAGSTLDCCGGSSVLGRPGYNVVPWSRTESSCLLCVLLCCWMRVFWFTSTSWILVTA